ncbi:MAG: hypothetical protein J6X86_02815 [Bacteroidales bacterium]|nr:hypothetical protein [Bacteroidales bacterium]
MKGLLYSAALLLVLYILVVVLEYFGYFGTVVRTVMFWSFIAAAAAILAVYVVSPLLRMFSLGRRISYETAATIIGDHFPEVSDKLLNLLQLQKMGIDSDNELLRAGIEQKTRQLSPIPFLKAIDLGKNVKYVKYVAVPALFIIVVLIVAPSFITEPSKRLINHSTFYEKPAPFAFVLENKELSASQQEDFMVRVAVDGDEVPNEVSIVVDGVTYRMQKADNTHFTYLFKNLQRSHYFQFEAVGVVSQQYCLSVMPRPAVVQFQAVLSYPAYTGKENETLANIGDITLPKGTHIDWLFTTKDANSLHFVSDVLFAVTELGTAGSAKMSTRAMSSFSYSFFVENNFIVSDTLSYSISVIDDAYPMIAVMQMSDSLMPDRYFFKGNIKDDYGISKLDFVVERTNVSDTSVNEVQHLPVAVSHEPSQEFYYSTDLSQVTLNPGDKVKYYFMVWDNDGVNGAKATKSQTFEIQVPTEEEIDKLINSTSSDIHQQAEMSISELKKLQEEINEMMRKLVDKKELSWQDKKQIGELKKRQEEVRNQMQQMRQQMKENNRLEEKYRDQSEQLMEKQKELDRLFDEVMNDEIKEMMKEMERLMQEMDKKKVQEELENLKLKNEDIEKQLDQNIELLKRLEIEKKVEQAVNKAEELAKKQEELSNRQDDAKQNLKEQESLSEQYQQLKKDIEQIQKDYKNLEQPSDFKIDKGLQNKIDSEQQQAKEELSKGKKKNASKSQKSAAEDLQKLSEQLAEAQMNVEQEDLAEDAEQVRQLLKNLVQLSFNQESLINTVALVNVQDPKYQQIILEQNKLKDDFRNVEDSLRAMAKRQVAVAAVINKELGEVNSSIARSLNNLVQFNQSFYANYHNTSASSSMQYSMTALNNLSLVLAESLDQMQNQMRQNQQQKQQGSCKRQGMKMKGSCSKPGSGKPSPKSMRQMQEQLNKQLNDLKNQLEKQGQKPGRAKIGEHNSMSSEFAKMAAQQEQIRRMMQEYGQKMKEESGGNSKLAREIDEMMRQMEQTETDLVNKTITRQTIQRQQQIMTRLLQHEKAEMEREKEERRESTEGKDIFQPSQTDMERYKKLQENNIELFHSTPPTLNNYYKNKVNDYFFKF